MSDYPEKNCPAHPERLWEWDGYGYVCVDCIMDKPRESERTITLPVDKVRLMLDRIVETMDWGSGFFDQEDTDLVRWLATLLGDVCLQKVTPSNMRYKYPPCVGTATWTRAFIERHKEHGWPLSDRQFECHTGHDDHPYPEQ